MPPACPPLSSFAAEVTAHLNKQHSLSMMVGIGTFDQPVIRWHFERGSADELATLDGKLAADRDYSALVEKYKDTWFTQHSSFRKVDGRQSVTMPKGTEFIARREFLLHKEDTDMIVNFRPMQVEDKELFKSFIRSLPSKDNFFLMVNVHNDQAIDRWMEKIQSGETIGVIATKGGDMIGYSNVKINDLPWTRHVGEIRLSVSPPYRGRGVGKALAAQIFSVARAQSLQKIWARMAISQDAAQHMFMKLGFRTEAVLSGFVKNENGLTDDLVIMSYDSGEHWSF